MEIDLELAQMMELADCLTLGLDTIFKYISSNTVTSISFSISGRLRFAAYGNGDCYVWDTLLAKVLEGASVLHTTA